VTRRALCGGLLGLLQARPAPALPRAAAATPIHGVTIDGIDRLDATVEALGRLARKPTTRIVFDSDMPAAHYRDATRAIHAVSHVMGEILDSQFVGDLSVEDYLRRTREYLDTLGETVDLWEIGNEVNGEWLGTPQDVAAKIAGAFDLVRARGRPTVLTLYYNVGCGAPAANEVFTWVERHLPERLRTDIDYVLLSYYEDDCGGRQPRWPAVFARLGRLFPTALLGFGEIGTTDPARKLRMLERYYAMRAPSPRFIGGYFWWYFRQDMVPAEGNPLWKALNTLVQGQRPSRP
jgi:hypothetical protein